MIENFNKMTKNERQVQMQEKLGIRCWVIKYFGPGDFTNRWPKIHEFVQGQRAYLFNISNSNRLKNDNYIHLKCEKYNSYQHSFLP